MTQQKKNRIAAAITVNAVLLIVILAVYVIYQLAVIVSTANQLEKLEKEYATYEQLYKDKELELEDLQEMLNSDRELFYLALKYGYQPAEAD